MTEDEAKTKICHKTAAALGMPRWSAQPASCIGSECMAWRWDAYPERVQVSSGFATGRMGRDPIPGTIGADVPDAEVHTSYSQTVPNRAPRTGGCGLVR